MGHPQVRLGRGVTKRTGLKICRYNGVKGQLGRKTQDGGVKPPLQTLTKDKVFTQILQTRGYMLVKRVWRLLTRRLMGLWVTGWPI
jgi:hypothetical protein